MPVYLCKPGVFSNEPWRHGIPVYAEPFALSTPSTNPPQQQRQTRESSSLLSQQEEESRANYPSSEASSLTGVTPHPQQRHHQQQQPQPDESKAIRRIRHSEVVLVDDVVLVYQNYWLKLRWPGSNGGFAGYVCLVGANKQQPSAATDATAHLVDGGGGENIRDLFCKIFIHSPNSFSLLTLLSAHPLLLYVNATIYFPLRH